MELQLEADRLRLGKLKAELEDEFSKANLKIKLEKQLELEEQIKELREKQEKEKKEKAKQHKKSLETFDVLKKELDSKKKLTKKAKKTSNEDDLSKN